MEFKGTKGKWYFDKENAKVYKEDGNTLCRCYYNIFNKEESEPNALLISKAPEMLEMLKEIYDEWCETGIGENKLSEYMLKAKQLIKEATELN